VDLLGFGGIHGVMGQDGQHDLGAFGPADHVNDAAQFHADDLDGFAARLLHRDNLVVHVDLAAEIRRTAGLDLLDHAVAVVLDAQHGADADEREFHLDAEILQGVGGKIGGMGVIHPGEAGEKHLLHVERLDIADILQHALIAFAHGCLGLRRGFLGQQVLQDLVFDAAPPQVIGLGGVGGEIALAAIRGVELLDGEIMVALQLLENPVGARFHAVLVGAEDREGGVDVAEVGEVGLDAGAVLTAEVPFVLGREKQAVGVQALLHVVGDELRVIRRGDGVLVVMIGLQQLDQRAGLLLHDRRGLEIAVRHRVSRREEKQGEEDELDGRPGGWIHNLGGMT